MIRETHFMKRMRREEIQFFDESWQASFERYTVKARLLSHYRERVEFAELWMKVMQIQMESGLCDPDVSFWRVIEIMKYRPMNEEIVFARGVIGSHWAHRECFVRYTSSYEENALEEIERFKKVYYLSVEKFRKT